MRRDFEHTELLPHRHTEEAVRAYRECQGDDFDAAADTESPQVDGEMQMLAYAMLAVALCGVVVLWWLS